MCGWMAIKDVCGEPAVVKAVVPTIAIPFAAAFFLLNALATSIASLFGVKLKLEGPKRFFEVLLKPRVLLGVVALNLIFTGGYFGYRYWKNTPAALWRVQRENEKLQREYASEARSVIYLNTSRENNDTGQISQFRAGPVSFRQVWRTKIKKGSFGSLSLSGSSAFVGSDDGYVYELARDSGKILRRFFVGGKLTPEPIIWNSRLFIGEGVHDTRNARVYAFDLKSGAFLGAVQTRGHTEGTPLISEYRGRTLLFVMAGSDGLYAVDPISLEVKWHQILGHTDSEVRIWEGHVYFATAVEKGFPENIRRAYSLNFETGEVEWSAELPASGWMPPVVTERHVCWGLGEIYGKSRAGYLSCFDRLTGAPQFTTPFQAPVLGIPFLVGTTLAISTMSGEVCALSYPEGTKLWCKPGNVDKTYTSVTYDGHGRFLYASKGDGIYAYERHTGTLLGHWLPAKDEGKWEDTYSRVVVAEDGFYTSDSVGNIRRLEQIPPNQR